MNTIQRIILRHHLRCAQSTVTWEKNQFLEIPEAESVGVLPYDKWLDLFRRFINKSDLSAEDLRELSENFQIDYFYPKKID